MNKSSLTESTQPTHYSSDELELETTAPSGKNLKLLTPKQQAFLHALEHEAKGDVREAMRLAGYSPLTRPNEVTNGLTEQIIEATQKALATNSMKAAIKLMSVLDSPEKPGNKEIIAAAKEVLDRVGVHKKVDGSGGPTIQADNVFILPPKDQKRIG